jgi:hypothetical protein
MKKHNGTILLFPKQKPLKEGSNSQENVQVTHNVITLSDKKYKKAAGLMGNDQGENEKIIPRFLPVEEFLREPEFGHIPPEDLSQWIADSEHQVLDDGSVVAGNGLDKALHIIDDTLYIDRLEFLFWGIVHGLRREFEEDFPELDIFNDKSLIGE